MLRYSKFHIYSWDLENSKSRLRLKSTKIYVGKLLVRAINPVKITEIRKAFRKLSREPKSVIGSGEPIQKHRILRFMGNKTISNEGTRGLAPIRRIYGYNLKYYGGDIRTCSLINTVILKNTLPNIMIKQVYNWWPNDMITMATWLIWNQICRRHADVWNHPGHYPVHPPTPPRSHKSQYHGHEWTEYIPFVPCRWWLHVKDDYVISWLLMIETYKTNMTTIWLAIHRIGRRTWFVTGSVCNYFSAGYCASPTKHDPIKSCKCAGIISWMVKSEPFFICRWYVSS